MFMIVLDVFGVRWPKPEGTSSVVGNGKGGSEPRKQGMLGPKETNLVAFSPLTNILPACMKTLHLDISTFVSISFKASRCVPNPSSCSAAQSLDLLPQREIAKTSRLSEGASDGPHENGKLTVDCLG